jgi:hypothetical protein
MRSDLSVAYYARLVFRGHVGAVPIEIDAVGLQEVEGRDHLVAIAPHEIGIREAVLEWVG